MGPECSLEESGSDSTSGHELESHGLGDFFFLFNTFLILLFPWICKGGNVLISRNNLLNTHLFSRSVYNC